MTRAGFGLVDMVAAVMWVARRMAVSILLLMIAAACAGSGGGPEDQAMEYAVEFGGRYIGGLSPDLGWEAADVFVTDPGDCAAVALVADDGFSVVMLLANRDHHSIAEIYAEEPDRVGLVSSEVSDRRWVPTPDSPVALAEDLTAAAYREGTLAFGLHCETVSADVDAAVPLTDADASAFSTLSMRPVLGVFTISPAFSDPSGDHPPGVDPETGVTLVDEVTAEAYLTEPTTGQVYWVAPAFITNADINDAEAMFTSGDVGSWVVVPEFTIDGGEKFKAATAVLAQEPLGSPTRQIAIVVDGEIISAPTLAAEVGPEGLDPEVVVITIGAGDEAQQKAMDIAATLQR